MAADRERYADGRDAEALARLHVAEHRDVAAERRDRAAEKRSRGAQALPGDSPSHQHHRGQSDVDRVWSGMDRDAAASDRSAEAEDRRAGADLRDWAALDRAASRRDREEAARDRDAALWDRKAAVEHAAQLEEAVASSRLIGTAIGILMQQGRLTRGQALDVLTAAAKRENRTLRHAARDVVESAETPAGRPADSGRRQDADHPAR